MAMREKEIRETLLKHARVVDTLNRNQQILTKRITELEKPKEIPKPAEKKEEKKEEEKKEEDDGSTK